MAGHEFLIVMGLVCIVAIVVCVYEHYKEKETGEISVSTHTAEACQKCPKCGNGYIVTDLFLEQSDESMDVFLRSSHKCHKCGFEHIIRTRAYDKRISECEIKDAMISLAYSHSVTLWDKIYSEYKKGEK